MRIHKHMHMHHHPSESKEENSFTSSGYCGEVNYLMVHKSYRRRGIATALLQAVAQKLQEEPTCCSQWRLHVRPDNHAATALYRNKFGFQKCHGTAEVHLTSWDSVLDQETKEEGEEKKPDDNDDDMIGVQPVSPEEEAAIESTFGLVRGVFAQARAFGGRIPLQLKKRRQGNSKNENGDNELLLGCCIFDPAFPGAYPFCVQNKREEKPLAADDLFGFAKKLLQEMYKHRHTEKEDVFLLIENQDALVEALVAAVGAKVEIHLECYLASLAG
jgi:hypothetical protein